VTLSIQAPQNVFPSVQVDVNGNGVLDPGLDTYYATQTGLACNGYLLGVGSNTECGKFPSSGSVKFSILNT